MTPFKHLLLIIAQLSIIKRQNSLIAIVSEFVGSWRSCVAHLHTKARR